MGMPRSAIRYRSIDATGPLDAPAQRATRSHQSTTRTLATSLTSYIPPSWHLPFCCGMGITLIMLLCGRLIG